VTPSHPYTLIPISPSDHGRAKTALCRPLGSRFGFQTANPILRQRVDGIASAVYWSGKSGALCFRFPLDRRRRKTPSRTLWLPIVRGGHFPSCACLGFVVFPPGVRRRTLSHAFCLCPLLVLPKRSFPRLRKSSAFIAAPAPGEAPNRFQIPMGRS